METNMLDERLRFVGDVESGHWSMTELCERYGVTRPTGYKWMARHREAGGAGLADRSRAPHQCPHRTSADLEALIVAARHEYGWAAGGVAADARTEPPPPARSTNHAIPTVSAVSRRPKSSSPPLGGAAVAETRSLVNSAG